MSSRRRTFLAAGLAVSAIAALQTAVPTTPAHADGATLVVNAAAPFRPVTHAAAGGLYGLIEGNRPANALMYPLHLRTVTQPAPGVRQAPNGQPPAGDALLVAPQADRLGASVIIRMPDIYPNFPYRWVSWDDWLAKVDAQVNARLARTDVTNIEGYELWNEPDGTWNTAAAGDFNAGWARTFRRVRAKDPVTPIIGPSLSWYNGNYMRSFLTYARDNGVLPDVVCWHELAQDPSAIAADIAAYRALERSLGISPRRIAVNEYAGTDAVDRPGAAASFIAKLERGGVDSADRAFWYEYGTLNGLVTDGRPTGTYWLYKWYGDMAGSMVATTPAAQTGLDGFASYDGTRKIVNVVAGHASGTNTVRVTGLNALGPSVRVRLESTPYSGRHTAVAGPTAVWDRTYTVNNGEISVPVSGMDASSAYHLSIEPTGGVPAYQHRYEAENAAVFRAERLSSGSASNGGYVGRIDNTGDPRTDSYVDFIVNVPSARTYTMKIGYANGTGATATQGIAYNGGAWSTISYPPTGGWGQFGSTVSTTVNLPAGYSVIRLAKGSPYFQGGTGYAELDYIELN
ncbi:carbohydrate-binding protein [Actinomadura chokoriensis]|uniref:carbohydrate-binding protein n=1 Tax=Actinomadura chokoriensis TaxID=454156 RepID=UPI0031FA2998